MSNLLDTLQRPIRDLRISVTDKCNFRCPYCMPAEIFGEKYEFLPKAEILTFEEITRLARVFVELGVTKIRVTGGEPLLRRDLETLIAKLSQISGHSRPHPHHQRLSPRRQSAKPQRRWSAPAHREPRCELTTRHLIA